MTSKNLRELAKQGDPKVISSIINHSLQKKGINVQVTKDNDSFEIILESDEVSNQQASLVEFIRTGIVKLGVESINTVKVYGVSTGNKKPVWEEEFFLSTPGRTNTFGLEKKSEAEDLEQDKLEAAYETETDEDYEEAEYEEEVEYENYNDDDYNDDELSDEPQSQKKKIPLIAAILLSVLLVLVAASAALYFGGIFRRTPPTPPPSSPTLTPESPPTVSNPWYFAVTNAQKAAEKAQTAKTKSEWNTVANYWQEAVDLMKEVPESHPEYKTAQTKIVEYQNYLDIAKQRADKAPN